MAIQQGAGYSDEGQGRVGCDFGVARCRCVAAGAVSLCPQRIVPNSPNPVGHFVAVPAAPDHQGGATRVGGGPLGQVALAQKVLVVEAQFLQAGPGHAGQLEFRLLRGPTGRASFGDVLHPAARRLNHLVPRPAAGRDIALAKPHRDVVAQPRQLKALQLPVPAMPGNDRLQRDPPVSSNPPAIHTVHPVHKVHSYLFPSSINLNRRGKFPPHCPTDRTRRSRKAAIATRAWSRHPALRRNAWKSGCTGIRFARIVTDQQFFPAEVR